MSVWASYNKTGDHNERYMFSWQYKEYKCVKHIHKETKKIIDMLSPKLKEQRKIHNSVAISSMRLQRAIYINKTRVLSVH